jgi:hypothetical protein
MKSLLKKYIKSYLKEAASTAIAMPARDITGKTQHQNSASYRNNMTSLDDEEVLVKVLENVGDNCFISFVDNYDESIPRLEINPKVSYDTPHGNYAYPLTAETLKELIEKSSIGNARFALERPYFHLFRRSDSLNTIDINKDGSNNYSGDFRRDLKTIVHTSIMFAVALRDEYHPSSGVDPNANKYFEASLNRLKKFINNPIDVKSEDDRYIFLDDFEYLIEQLYKIKKYSRNKSMPSDALDLAANFVCQYILLLSRTPNNAFFDESKNATRSRFHDLYFACYLLSHTLSGEEEDYYPTDESVDKTTGPIFTMLLNSIDVDFINDKGSSTLHFNEAIQAVYLNSSKKESVVLIGTFNNIFQHNKKDINSLIQFAMSGKSQNSDKKITMNKIVDVIDRNPRLVSLFDSILFDNPKFDDDINLNRITAWEKLTSENVMIEKIKMFHSTNKIFNLQITKGKNNIILFDIGFKDEFVNLTPSQKHRMIIDNMSSIVQVQMYTAYILKFLNSYINKDVYSIQDKTATKKMRDVIYQIEDYLANYDKSDIKDVSMKLSFFLNIASDIENLCYIAAEHS